MYLEGTVGTGTGIDCLNVPVAGSKKKPGLALFFPDKSFLKLYFKPVVWGAALGLSPLASDVQEYSNSQKVSMIQEKTLFSIGVTVFMIGSFILTILRWSVRRGINKTEKKKHCSLYSRAL